MIQGIDYAETIAVQGEGLYAFLGVDQHGKITYFQARDDEIHVPLFEDGMEIDLNLHFREQPLETFHSYIQDSTWQVLEEPDYEEIAEEHGFEIPELDAGAEQETPDGQSDFDRW